MGAQKHIQCTQLHCPWICNIRLVVQFLTGVCIFKIICQTLKCVESQCISTVNLILANVCCAVRKYKNKGDVPWVSVTSRVKHLHTGEGPNLMYFPAYFQKYYSLIKFLMILAFELCHLESFLMCLKSFWAVLSVMWTMGVQKLLVMITIDQKLKHVLGELVWDCQDCWRIHQRWHHAFLQVFSLSCQ